METLKFYNSKLKKPQFLHFYPPSSVICKRWRIHCNISLPVKQRKCQVLEIGSVPKSMGQNETSPVLTPHCALDPTECTDPFLQTGFQMHHTREAAIKCIAGLSLAMLSFRLPPDQRGPVRGSLRQAVTSGWYSMSVQKHTWPEQDLNPHHWLRKDLSNATASTPSKGEVPLVLHCLVLKDSLQSISRFTKHGPVSVLVRDQ